MFRFLILIAIFAYSFLVIFDDQIVFNDEIVNENVNWVYPGYNSKWQRNPPVSVRNDQGELSLKLVWNTDGKSISERVSTIDKPRTQIQSTAAFYDGLIITKNTTGDIIALDIDGRKIWDYKPTLGSIAFRGWVIDDNINARFFAPEGSTLTCLYVKDGVPCNDFGGEGGNPKLCDSTRVNPILTDNTIITIGMNFCITIIDKHTGMVITSKPINNNNPSNFGSGVWSGLAFSKEYNMIIAGTANAKPTFGRLVNGGETGYANSVVGIDANNGDVIWSVKEIPNDIWDLDISAPPIIGKFTINSQSYDVAFVATKSGNLITVDIETGNLLNTKATSNISTSGVDISVQDGQGNTQLTCPGPFSKQEFVLSDLSYWKKFPNIYYDLYEKFVNSNTGLYSDHSTEKPSLYFGVHGGAEWPGGAYNSTLGNYYIVSNHIPWRLSFNIGTKFPAPIEDNDVFKNKCFTCHVNDAYSIYNYFENSPNYPDFKELLQNGRRKMPSVLTKDNEISLLFDILSKYGPVTDINPVYELVSWSRFTSSDGSPGSSPPWSTINSLNVSSNENCDILWSVPFGSSPHGRKNKVNTGSESFAGITLSEDGVIFASGADDKMLYAIDELSGQTIATYKMPHNGSAAPTLFRYKDKSYLFIQSSGGGKLSDTTDDSLLLFEFE